MTNSSNQRKIHWPDRKTVFLTILFLVSAGLVFAILLLPIYTSAIIPHMIAGIAVRPHVKMLRIINTSAVIASPLVLASKGEPPAKSQPQDRHN